jgi:hypothetical protein
MQSTDTSQDKDLEKSPNTAMLSNGWRESYLPCHVFPCHLFTKDIDR